MRIRGAVKRNRRLREPFLRRAKRFLAGSFRLILAALAIPLAGFAGYLIYRGVTTAEYLAVRAVNVDGTSRVAKEEVVEASGIKPGQNILSFSARAVEDNLKGNPWIFTASVTRRLPDTVEIKVREREPAAFVKMDGLFLMDSTGAIFKRAARSDDLDLPVITGLNVDVMREDGLQEGLLDLLRVLRSRKGFNAEAVSEIHIDPVYGLSLYTLDDGVRLEMGKSGFEEKIRSFERVAASRDGVLKGIEAMDLTREREAVVRFKSNVAKEGGAI